MTKFGEITKRNLTCALSKLSTIPTGPTPMRAMAAMEIIIPMKIILGNKLTIGSLITIIIKSIIT